ncbi:MAG: NifU family protein [Acidobacteriota bacterium]
MKEKVQKVIDEIKPALQRDGGDIELVDIIGDEVRVRLTGACVGCPMSAMTLAHFVEQKIRETIPEIKRVISV